MADKKKEKNPVIAYIIALVMGGHFIYKGIKYTMIDMTTSGLLLTICGVVLVAVSIFMFFRNLKRKTNNDPNTPKRVIELWLKLR